MKQLLEKAINRYLALDSESKKRIHFLQNKIVTLELRGTPLTMQMIFSNDTVHLKWDHFNDPDLIIRGTPLNLLHMSLVTDRRKFFAEDIVVEGNMELAQQVLAIFDDLEIDWEEYISTWVGDVPAYQTGRIFRHLKNTSQRIRNLVSNNLNEYVHEEINLFPPEEALQDFFQAVDELRMDVDRIEARINKIEEKV